VRHRYAIALGSNRYHGRIGAPGSVLKAALRRIDRKNVHVVAASRTVWSRPIGPSRRTYANAAAILESRLGPKKLLHRLKKIEREFGLRRGGLSWSARTLDLDIILWSGGCRATPDLVIPHREFRSRHFVLDPLATIAGRWRDPISRLTVRQLKARLDRKRPAA